MSASMLAVVAALLAADQPEFRVLLKANHEIVLRLGPFQLPASRPAPGHEGMHHEHGLELPLFRFTWPEGGWLRGFRVTLLDAQGQVLPRRLLHHVNLVHLERRQLAQPIYERTVAAGQETEAVILPRSLGVRMDSGASMALLTAWSNETGSDLEAVILELTLPYLPENTSPRPRDVRPMAFDIGFRPGTHDAFDLDTGRTVHQREFVLPVGGRLLAAGGHLHDFAESLQLFDAASGKLLLALQPRLDARGRILGMARKLLAIRGDGLQLQAGRAYRVVAVYHNRTGAPLENGGMAVLGGVFAPDDPARWPGLDRGNSTFVADAAGLDRIGWAPPPPGRIGLQRH